MPDYKIGYYYIRPLKDALRTKGLRLGDYYLLYWLGCWEEVAE